MKPQEEQYDSKAWLFQEKETLTFETAKLSLCWIFKI
jgi:hypothetical protein